MATLVNAPLETITFVQNATTGVNVVLRNLEYESGDVILTCENIYGACDKTVQYLCQTTSVESVHYTPTLPLTEDDLVAGFEAKIRQIASESGGKRRVKVALFDAISSMPAARWPWERLVQVCKANGVLSCIDGAHGIGAIDLDLTKSDPDFFVSNCHKWVGSYSLLSSRYPYLMDDIVLAPRWLFVPKSCAIFYVPVRNQHMMRSTLPTSFGLVSPLNTADSSIRAGTPVGDSHYINNFSYYGTLDNSSLYCIPEAIRFRQEVCGGEQAIREYSRRLAWDGAKVIADMLKTRVLSLPSTDSPMANLLLPLDFDDEGKLMVDSKSTSTTFGQTIDWLGRTMAKRYNTFMAIMAYQGSLWIRTSGQVYLELDDFVEAGRMLKTLCEEIGSGAIVTA